MKRNNILTIYIRKNAIITIHAKNVFAISLMIDTTNMMLFTNIMFQGNEISHL